MKWLIAVLVGLILFGVVVVPSLTSHWGGRSARITTSLANLLDIRNALMRYSVRHQGGIPPTLETLVSERLITRDELSCPSTNNQYLYLGLSLDPKDSQTLIAFETMSPHRERLGACALFADGHSEFLREDKLQTALLKTMAKLRDRSTASHPSS
jgi:hypothetical protein